LSTVFLNITVDHISKKLMTGTTASDINVYADDVVIMAGSKRAREEL